MLEPFWVVDNGLPYRSSVAGVLELRRGAAVDEDGDDEEVSGRFQGSVSVANPPVFGRGTSGPTRGSEDEPVPA